MTPSADRSAWLEERRQGLGGSDVAALYNLEYSCRRKLFYDKRNTPEDFPREETKAMRLGTFMEEYAAQEYARETGREVERLDEPLCSAPPLRVNVDRMVWNTIPPIPYGANGNFGAVKRGPLEIKSMGREMFYRTKREGLSRSYILQLQAGMIAANASWGSFAVLSRDSGDIIYFDVERDEALCKAIVSDAEIFWAQVQNGPIPDALEPDDRRCQKCEFRVTCQGNALVQLEPEGEIALAPDLDALVAEKIERDALFDQATDLCNETDEEIKAKLGDRQAVLAADRKVYFRPQGGRTLYKGKELLAAYRGACRVIADLIVRYGIQDANPESIPLPAHESFLSGSKPSRPLRVMPKGGK